MEGEGLLRTRERRVVMPGFHTFSSQAGISSSLALYTAIQERQHEENGLLQDFHCHECLAVNLVRGSVCMATRGVGKLTKAKLARLHSQ
jgi:hypothetical protein